MVERQLPKLHTRVRFPSPAPLNNQRVTQHTCQDCTKVDNFRGANFLSTEYTGRMFKKLSAVFLLLGFLSSAGHAATKESNLLAEERIGSLRVGLPETDLKKSIDCDLKCGPETLWGADGAYHQTWQCPACGLKLGMVSNKRGGTKTIESITLAAPCTLATKRGIRIGSTEQEVKKAYKKDWNKEDSTSSGRFVAGSIYGGIVFEFQNGKVSRIFLGAAAE